MPPTNVTCPCSPGTHPLTHWGQDCTLPADTRSWYAALLHRALNDPRHCAGNITVTRLLTCPCEWLLQDFLPYTFYPKSAHTPHVGTLVQAEKARFAPLGWVAEREVAGTLWGLPISASIDLSKLEGEPDKHTPEGLRYYAKKGYICEGKFHAFDKDGNQPWTLKPDHACQVNMQRLLWEQCEPGLRVVEMKVSRDSMSGKASKTFEVPEWSLEQIGGHRPGGGSFTVKQIAGFVTNFQNALNFDGATEDRELVKQAIRDSIPMCCSEMYNGKKRELYMQQGVKSICEGMRKGTSW